MDKQTPTQLFLSIFLRAAVAVLGIAICIFGIFFLTKYVKNGHKKADKPATTVDESVLTEVGGHDDLLMNTTATTESASSTDATDKKDKDKDKNKDKKDDPFEKNILVLNSTSQSGLAGGWCSKLEEKGYKHTTASDFSNELQRTKIVAQKNGDGKEFMELFNSPVYEVGVVSDGAPFETSDYDVVIIIGTNDATETSTEGSSDDSNSDNSNSDDASDESSDDSYYDDTDDGSSDEEYYEDDEESNDDGSDYEDYEDDSDEDSDSGYEDEEDSDIEFLDE